MPTVVDVQAKLFAAAIGTTDFFANPPVAGGCIVVGVDLAGNPSSDITAPTDPFSNLYLPIGTGKDIGGWAGMKMFMAKNIATGANHSVSAHCTAANGAVVAWALDDADDENGDWVAELISAGTVDPSATTIVAPAPNSMFISMIGHAAATDFGAPSGWNAVGHGFTAPMDAAGRASARNGFAGQNLESAYKVGSAVDIAQWIGTMTTLPGIVMIVSIAPAAGAPGATGDMFTMF